LSRDRSTELDPSIPAEDAMTTPAVQPVTYRRDRGGECWHMVPAGERGPRGRTLCGEPRQGTPLSETYAETEPTPPDCVCARCIEAVQVRVKTQAS
jgi:hypothetical protein